MISSKRGHGDPLLCRTCRNVLTLPRLPSLSLYVSALDLVVTVALSTLPFRVAARSPRTVWAVKSARNRIWLVISWEWCRLSPTRLAAVKSLRLEDILSCPNSRHHGVPAVVASSGLDSHINIWSIQGTLLKSIDAGPVECWTVALSPDDRHVASGTQGGNINIWRSYAL